MADGGQHRNGRGNGPHAQDDRVGEGLAPGSVAEPANRKRGAKPGKHKGRGVRKTDDKQACGTGCDGARQARRQKRTTEARAARNGSSRRAYSVDPSARVDHFVKRRNPRGATCPKSSGRRNRSAVERGSTLEAIQSSSIHIDVPAAYCQTRRASATKTSTRASRREFSAGPRGGAASRR